MSYDWREYVEIGVNHHLLYCDAVSEPEAHEKTLQGLFDDERLEALDLWIPADKAVARREIRACLACGKDIHYNIGTRPGCRPLEPASADPETRQYSLQVYREELDRARESGAVKVVTNSGPDRPTERKAAIAALVDFYCELCAYVPESTLVLVEPTDRDMSKYKLIGPSAEAAELVRRVRAQGHPNMASMIDMGHLPLMHESIEQGFADTGEFCEHMHLGNCILRDRSHPLFGDKHVPWGIRGGEYDVPDIVQLFDSAFASGYLGRGRRGSMTFEMRPYPGLSQLASLDRFFELFDEAWHRYLSQRAAPGFPARSPGSTDGGSTATEEQKP